MARAWDVLMKRLGYKRYVAQGGDWGAFVVDQMGVQAPRDCSPSTPTCPASFRPTSTRRRFAGAPPPAGLSAEEKHAYEQLAFVYAEGVDYAFQMGARPQTLYGIADSPVGLAAYLLDHDARSLRLIARVFDGAVRRPHARRRPRQHHAVLADEHGRFRVAALLGVQGKPLLQPEGRQASRWP